MHRTVSPPQNWPNHAVLYAVWLNLAGTRWIQSFHFLEPYSVCLSFIPLLNMAYLYTWRPAARLLPNPSRPRRVVVW